MSSHTRILFLSRRLAHTLALLALAIVPAVAFAVLLLNLSAPFIDYYTQPRAYGHRKANKGANP